MSRVRTIRPELCLACRKDRLDSDAQFLSCPERCLRRGLPIALSLVTTAPAAVLMHRRCSRSNSGSSAAKIGQQSHCDVRLLRNICAMLPVPRQLMETFEPMLGAMTTQTNAGQARHPIHPRRDLMGSRGRWSVSGNGQRSGRTRRSMRSHSTCSSRSRRRTTLCSSTAATTGTLPSTTGRYVRRTCQRPTAELNEPPSVTSSCMLIFCSGWSAPSK
jgi:hypothetical protein